MRSFILIGLCAGATIGCGGDTKAGPDAYTGNHPPPRVIAGGGIGDGPVDGVVNLYVIDDVTRQPVSGATVRVGGMDGTTDDTGLFVANNVAGPQQVAVSAPNYRSELWLGANGANMTVDVKPAIDPAVTRANLSGSITGFDAVTVPTGHHKAAIVSYSQDDKATDAENNLATANNANICDTGVATGGCTFTVTARTGHVALIAMILDHDLNGTPLDPSDDKYTVIGWAARTGLVVTDAADQVNVALSIVPVGQLANVSVTLGSPPLAQSAALVGLELSQDGVAYFGMPLSAAAPTILAPSLDAFPGARYRLIGFSSTGSGSAVPQAAIVLRGQVATSLTAPTWLAPPTALSRTRTGGSWDAMPTALVQGAEYDAGTTHLLSVTAFDGSTSFVIPDLVSLPVSGALTAKGTALGGSLDLTSFSIDADLAKVTAFSSQPMTIN